MSSAWVHEYLQTILEAAFPIGVAKQRLRDLQDPIAAHLFKVFFLPDDQAASHWTKELITWAATLIRVSNVKTKSGRGFSIKELRQVLWEEPFGTKSDLEINAALLDLPAEDVLGKTQAFKDFVESYVQAIYDRKKWSATART